MCARRAPLPGLGGGREGRDASGCLQMSPACPGQDWGCPLCSWTSALGLCCVRTGKACPVVCAGQGQLCSGKCPFLSAQGGVLVAAHNSQSLGGLPPSPTWQGQVLPSAILFPRWPRESRMTSCCQPRQGDRRPHGRVVGGVGSAERRVSRGGSCLQRSPGYSAARCCTETLEGPPTCEIWAELSRQGRHR